MITLTKDAKDRLLTLLAHNHFSGFRFGISGGGCSGFNYNLEPINDMEIEWSLQDGDEQLDLDGVPMVVDGASIFAIVGTEIDYKSDMMGAHFTFRNPNAAAQCGCGTSFSV